MLKGIYVPTDYPSYDADPTISPAEKLRIIADTPVWVPPSSRRDKLGVRLPYGGGASLLAPEKFFSRDHLYLSMIDIGDKELYGHGIGTRLVKAAVRYTMEGETKPERLTTDLARLGVVNMVVGMLGEDNVAVLQEGQRYGWKSDRPLDQFLSDFPPLTDEPYCVEGIDAKIDPMEAMNWEMPVTTLPTFQ